jgi:PAS domain S-box-containing protein
MLYVSPAMERLLGHPVTEVEGRRNLAFIHPDDHVRCEAALAELLAAPRRVVRLRCRAPHRDGTYHWMEGVATNLVDEPHVGAIVVSLRDISEQRRAEDLLRESEARFALAVEGVKDGIWDWHLDAGNLFLSPRSRELLDLAADEPAGLDVLAARIHPDDEPRVRERWQGHLESDQSHFEVEFRSRKAGGGYHWLLARVRTVRGADARPARAASTSAPWRARRRSWCGPTPANAASPCASKLPPPCPPWWPTASRSSR